MVNALQVAVVAVMMFPDGRMDTRNAALYLGLEEKTLAMKRSDGTGPPFIKRGRVFYFKEDLDDWINQCDRATSTGQLRTIRKSRQSRVSVSHHVEEEIDREKGRGTNTVIVRS